MGSNLNAKIDEARALRPGSLIQRYNSGALGIVVETKRGVAGRRIENPAAQSESGNWIVAEIDDMLSVMGGKGD